MSRPFPPRSFPPSQLHRINGKIRAREVRVIGHDGQQIGVIALNDALNLARQQGVDLVEISPNAVPPVCRIVDYGKFKYEQSKKDKDSKKSNAGKVKEIQLSVKIDPHDFATKLQHAVDFFSEDMKVKIALRFRGREMAHTEYGFQVVNKFIQECAPYATPEMQPKVIGKGINLMLNPLPRAKRAKNPKAVEQEAEEVEMEKKERQPKSQPKSAKVVIPTDAAEKPSDFGSSPFSQVNLPEGQ